MMEEATHYYAVDGGGLFFRNFGSSLTDITSSLLHIHRRVDFISHKEQVYICHPPGTQVPV
jgi:hypothetical protein